MVQKLSYTANSITLGTGTSKVVLGADSGNLIVKDSQSNTSIIEPGLGVQGGSPVAVYANSSVLPFSPISSAGSLAYATATSALYMSNGSGWYKITLVNTAPSIALSSTTASPTATNLTLDFTYTVTEPEGTPTTVTFANSGIATTGNVAVTHTASNNHIRLVFDGTTQYTGDATVTLSVTDGVNTGTGTITITTSYYDGLKSNLDSFILKADSSLGAVTTVQKSIGLNGSSEYLTVPNSDVALGTGNFTIETWVYLRSKLRAYPAIFANINNFTTGALSLFAGHASSSTTNFQIGHNGTFPAINAGTPNYNQWDHLAVVRNSGTITLYQNGTSIGSFSSTAALNGVGPTFYIGTTGDAITAGCVHGDYSNFRIVVGTAVYTGNFTPPSGELTKTGGTYPSTTNVNTSITASHTKLLTAQGTTTDNSDNSVTVTSVGTPDVLSSSPYHMSHIHRFLDSSSSVHRITRNGDVEQLSHSPFYEPGYSVKFDSGDEITFPDSNNYHLGTNQFSVEAWVFPTAYGSYTNGILGHFSSASRGWGFGFNSTTITFYGSSNGGSSTNQSHVATARVPTNKWTHLVATRDASRLRIFKDGLLVYNATNTASFHNSSQPLRIGDANPSVNQQLIGYLKDVRFVNGSVPTEYQTSSTETNVKIFDVPTSSPTAITNTQLLTCHANRIFDGSTHGASPTLVNTPITKPFSPYERSTKYQASTYGGSVYFDGTSNNWLAVADSDDLNVGTGDFTLECFIKPESGGTGGYGGIFGSHAYNNAMVQMQMSNGGVLRFVNPSAIAAAGSTDMRDGQWHHIAMCRQGSTLRGFVDGVQEISTTYSSSIDWGHNSSGAVVGITDRTTYPTNYLYKGYLSSLRLVKGTALYTSAFTPSTSPLTAVSNTKLLLNFGNASIFDASQVLERVTPLDGTTGSSGQQHFSENTIYFDGSSHINLHDTERFDLRSAGDDKDFTIESWIYKTSTSKDNWICQRTNSTTELTINLDADTSGYSAGEVNVEYDSGQYVVDVGIARNQWQHIAFVRSGNRINWYTDGVAKDTRTEPASLVDYSADFQIGRFSTNQHYYNGYMHDFRFTKDTSRYPYTATPVTLTTTNSGLQKPDGTTPTVTASNVTLLTCHAGTAGSQTITDGSTNNTTITVNGNASVSDFGPAPGMKSVYFDGTGDYLQCTLADTLGTNDWTLEYWVYHRTISGNHIHCAFNGYAPAFYRRSGSSALAVYHNPGISGNHNASSDATANKWFHMAYCHDTSENVMNVFRDGSLLDTFTYTGNINGTTFRIGDDGTSAWHNGYISNLRIVKDTVLYPNSFTPKTTALE